MDSITPTPVENKEQDSVEMSTAESQQLDLLIKLQTKSKR